MAVFLNIKVVANSGRHVCLVDKNGLIKCYVKASAVDGKANKELIRLIATLCDIGQKQVQIVRGLTSPHKRIAIDTDMTQEQIGLKLYTILQPKLF